MNLYVVTAALKFPSCYHSGYEYEIPAKNGAEAIKHARRMVWSDGHTKQDGALKFSFKKVEE